MQALKAFRSKAAGLPDLLSYAALVDEGVILCKDGSLLAGYFYRGDDAASATDAERNWLTAHVNTYLARFGSGWAAWIDTARLEAPGYPAPHRSQFPSPITAMIDAERRAAFSKEDAHYESEYALVVQFLPPLRRNQKLGELVYDDDNKEEGEPGDRQLADFKKKLADFESGLGDLLRLRRMGTIMVTPPLAAVGENGEVEPFASDELVNYLHYVINGKPATLRIPDCPMYLDAWLGMPRVWPGDTPKIGDKFVACVAIEGFPGASYPGVLNILDGLPIPYRWSTRFIFLDQHEATAALKRYRLKWQQKIRGFWSQVFRLQKGMVNTDALTMTEQAEAALGEAASGLVAYGYYTPVVVLLHEDRAWLEEHARYVKREVERMGFSARIETVNAVEAWLGTLPGHAHPNVRRPLVNTLNLSDLLPLTSVWPGLAECPCPLYPPNSPPLLHAVTTGATPFRLNLHVGDVGHTMVFGPTGAGKSTLLATILAQFFRYPRATVTAFDKGNSLLALSSATGGRHYDIGGEGGGKMGAMYPLGTVDTETERAWAEDWIATCFQLQANRPVTPKQRTAIHRAMMLLADADKDQRSLTHFVANVQDEEVRDALNHYTVSGGAGHLLDGQADTLTTDNFTVYEVDELMKMGNATAIPILLYLFRRFEKSLKGQPAILSLDEAWVMLGHPVFREKLREWLKEMRKKNCLVLLATQSLSDAVNSGLLDVLIEQCPTKILLPNPEADKWGTKDSPGPADLYTLFGLNSKEISILKRAAAKREYYYSSPLGRRKFELGLGPLALSFVAVSDKESVARVRQLSSAHGPDWPLVWMKERGVNYAQYAQ